VSQEQNLDEALPVEENLTVYALPLSVQQIAFLSPLCQLVSIIRPLVLGTVEVDVAFHLVWVVLFIMVFAVIPANLLNRKLVK
jgi:hypothetical protein